MSIEECMGKVIPEKKKNLLTVEFLEAMKYREGNRRGEKGRNEHVRAYQ